MDMDMDTYMDGYVWMEIDKIKHGNVSCGYGYDMIMYSLVLVT